MTAMSNDRPGPVPERDASFVTVYENPRVKGHVLRPLLRALALAAFGFIMAAGTLIAVAFFVGSSLGLLAIERRPTYLEPDALPRWVEIALSIFAFAFGIACVAEARRSFRRLAASRRRANEPESLAFVLGKPLFTVDEETGALLELSVAGDDFSLTDCPPGGAKLVPGYAWGMSRPLRGVMRVWFVRETHLLTRAEWHAFDADEVRREIDAVVADLRDHTALEKAIHERAAAVPSTARRLERFWQDYLRDLHKDLARIEALKTELVPGAPERRRAKAEDEFNEIVVCLRLTRSSVKASFDRVLSMGL